MPLSDLIHRVVARHRRANIVHRVVARHLEAVALTPEKLQELLLKVRKKATSSFNWKNIADVVEALGGKVTKTVGLIPVEKDYFLGDSEAEAAAKRGPLEKAVVPSLPSSPKHGQFYVTKLTPVEPAKHGHGFEFEFDGAIGNEGWLIEMPNGKTHLALPSIYDLGRIQHGFKPRPAAKISVYDTLAWLTKEGGWVELANAKLNMEPLEPSVPRTRENTGSCGVCFQNVKLKPGAVPKIVLHGYKRPGTGYIHGNCFGMGYPPFELSAEATKDFLKKVLEPMRDNAAKYVSDLKAGIITEFERHGRKRTKADPMWEYDLKDEIAQAERRLKGLDDEVEVFNQLVHKWKERPLPKEGERPILWYYEGRK